jgi:uncharacterized sporulation protein YeaH/YhbH (DUF444 family)
MTMRKQTTRKVVDGMKRVISAAANGRSGSVNVARRSNVVVSRNVGRPGASQAAIGRQRAEIVQTSNETPSRSVPAETRSEER